MIGAVVLAAGASTRFGSPKQTLLLPFVLESLGACPIDEIVVVEGAQPLEKPSQPRTKLAKCESWEQGPGASLRCGLDALGEEVAGALVVLADGPGLDPRAVERVLASRRAGDILLAASYDGSRSHPVYLAREGWGDIPDEGLRTREARLVPCDDLQPPGDIDTPEDWPLPV